MADKEVELCCFKEYYYDDLVDMEVLCFDMELEIFYLDIIDELLLKVFDNFFLEYV